MEKQIVKLNGGEIVKVLTQVKREDYMILTNENTTRRINAFAIAGLATTSEKNQFNQELSQILNQ